MHHSRKYRPARAPKHKAFRIEELSPPELTPDETDLFCRVMAQGQVDAFGDYPALMTDTGLIETLASAACQETDERRRVISMGAYIGGYMSIIVHAQADPIGTMTSASIAKSKTREENLLFYQAFVAMNLPQS
jgi:hypothetical protein